ncbi:MAG: flavodoxin family protein [Burkholderiaceae bacterium]|jgi:putative NADPH-quinone reductase|nr:MAG: flavodoxin family protein [Burkholderiaceae bacterium]
MNTLILAFHPHPARSRVQQAWLRRLRDAPEFHVHQVDAAYPDWRIDVAREQALLERSRHVVFMHPLYWYSVTPMMKLWLDEVLKFGWAFGPGVDRLAGKTWRHVVSTGATQADYQAGGFNEYTISELFKPWQRSAAMVGMRYLPPFLLHDSHSQDDAALARSGEQLLDALREPLAS